MELQTIKRLCYRECDQEIVAQLMECPSEALKYTDPLGWVTLGLSSKAAKNMADFINSALSMTSIHFTKTDYYENTNKKTIRRATQQ